MSEAKDTSKAKRLLLFCAYSSLAATSILAIALYVMLSPRMAEGSYAAALFHPDDHDYTPEFSQPLDSMLTGMHATKVDVKLPVKNEARLDAWYFHLAGSKKVVLISHGWGGNLTSRLLLVKMLLQSGASVVAYDYEGYG